MKAIISCIERVFRKNGISPGSKEELLSSFGTSIYDYIEAYLPPDQKHKAPALYAEFKEMYPYKVPDLLTPFPNVDETLYALKEKGIKIAVLSCMSKDEVMTNLSLLNFKDFDLVFSLEDYEIKRPAPDGLLKIMSVLAVQSENTCYVGDTVNDVLMAKNAGITAVAVRTGAQKTSTVQSAEPDVIMDSFPDILKLII